MQSLLTNNLSTIHSEFLISRFRGQELVLVKDKITEFMRKPKVI